MPCHALVACSSVPQCHASRHPQVPCCPHLQRNPPVVPHIHPTSSSRYPLHRVEHLRVIFLHSVSVLRMSRPWRRFLNFWNAPSGGAAYFAQSRVTTISVNQSYDIAVWNFDVAVNPMWRGSHPSFGLHHRSCYNIVFPDIVVQNYDILVQDLRHW